MRHPPGPSLAALFMRASIYVFTFHKNQKSCAFIAFVNNRRARPHGTPSGTPPGGTFYAPCALIPAKRPVGTPYVAKIALNFEVFKKHFIFCCKFSEVMLCFASLWNSYRYGGMGAPSRDAPGMLLNAPGLLPDAPKTLPDAPGRAHSGQKARRHALCRKNRC